MRTIFKTLMLLSLFWHSSYSLKLFIKTEKEDKNFYVVDLMDSDNYESIEKTTADGSKANMFFLGINIKKDKLSKYLLQIDSKKELLVRPVSKNITLYYIKDLLKPTSVNEPMNVISDIVQQYSSYDGIKPGGKSITVKIPDEFKMITDDSSIFLYIKTNGNNEIKTRFCAKSISDDW
ncbi:MAG: hypothetical protein HRT87_10570 [Legionellales bacterium]|nr:hypothetical protein [Legionellales bacterium]